MRMDIPIVHRIKLKKKSECLSIDKKGFMRNPCLLIFLTNTISVDNFDIHDYITNSLIG